MARSKLYARGYDWDGWITMSKKLVNNRIAQGWVHLSKGRDFNGMSHSFAVMIRRNVNSRGMRVETRVTETSVSFRVVGRKKRKVAS